MRTVSIKEPVKPRRRAPAGRVGLKKPVPRQKIPPPVPPLTQDIRDKVRLAREKAAKRKKPPARPKLPQSVKDAVDALRRKPPSLPPRIPEMIGFEKDPVKRGAKNKAARDRNKEIELARAAFAAGGL